MTMSVMRKFPRHDTMGKECNIKACLVAIGSPWYFFISDSYSTLQYTEPTIVFIIKHTSNTK
eukprot:CAMPEP_0116879276 /NCGR_PEP_ID=MMETSP0463-20121206/11078_1 /TAXON_ID=181622 /ORGANISM="Strombidinopsis sp, Strain SopsisLIS2011" /LENGTH=61 /DNA_ID=CAMNT_0004528439 /DNA_START=249 /DNA_END=434 /DNA_ORIENTATION=+